MIFFPCPLSPVPAFFLLFSLFIVNCSLLPVICYLLLSSLFFFLLLLTQIEYDNLKSQIATSNLKSQIATSSWGGRRKLPFAFTEHGVIMLSSVLNSKIATQINIAIVKAFIEMRCYIINEIITSLNNLIAQPPKTKKIGFNTDN